LEKGYSLLQETETFREAFPARVNETHERIHSNVLQNIKRQLPQLQAYPPNDYKVALLLGGPSLAQAKIPRGYKIATANNTHGWALERGLKPSVHMMLDARQFNARFVADPVSSCRYLINAQCHPDVFDALEGHDVHIWTGASQNSKSREATIYRRYFNGRWQGVMGGCTIGTRAIGLLYLIGVRHLRIYGMDGCLVRKAHHAYSQPENNAGQTYTIKIGRRQFKAHTWMVAQMDDFLMMAPHIPDDLEFSIEGDGMLAYLVRETTKRGKVPPIKMME
jgi:hypothetical protein